MIDILVVDDEPLARERLKRMVAKAEGYHVIGEAHSADAAMQVIFQVDPDIVLLDIQMPGDDGLVTAEKIAQLDNPPAIIFCTAFSDYALDAFHTVAVDYLLKPVRQEQLEAALDKVSSLNKVQRDAANKEVGIREASARTHIMVKTHKGIDLILLDDARVFVADQKYVTLHHLGGESLLDATLKELEEEFPTRLVRVHRNALVSIAHISGLDRSTDGTFSLRVMDAEQTPAVSRRHVAHVKALLQKI